jgi:hypothetical protein
VKIITPAFQMIAAVSICTAAVCVPKDVSAQDVKIEVSLRSTISDGVPRVLRYSGNIWWIPKVFAVGVADKILAMTPPGMARISLGDQVLQHADSLNDLRHRLESYPLNDFLRKYKAAGGRVLFILDGVPRWISSNKSTRQLESPTQPIFRMSPPADYREWSKVVEVIVRHFNGRLGLNAYYESWNEPNWYYLGTSEQYFRQYYHSVLGARRADPKALVGGPAISEFIGSSTRIVGKPTDAEKLDAVRQYLRQNYLFKQFLDYAGRTPVPELGLKKLPVDFFSWHGFYVDPTSYYNLVVPVIRDALVAAGYPRSTPLFNTEWNIAPVPPYPEGDLNANEVGAAFVATSLLAMFESGVDGQIFQMYLDPGVNGYSGGTLTNSGIPRANHNAFRLFSLVKGRQLRTRTSDPWVKSAAFSDGKRVYLLLSTLVPTTKMAVETLGLRSALETTEFARSLADAGLDRALSRGQQLPESFLRKGREIEEIYKKAGQRMQQKAATWKDGVNLEIELSESERPAGNVTRYLIDASHSNIYRDLAKAEKFLAEQVSRRAADINRKLAARLRENGIGDAGIRKLDAEMKKGKSPGEAAAKIFPDKREVITKAIGQALREAREQYTEVLAEIENWESARLHKDKLTWPSSGNLKIRTEPYSVQLLVFDR